MIKNCVNSQKSTTSFFRETHEKSGKTKQLGGVDTQGRQMLPQILNPHELSPQLMEMSYWSHVREMANDIFKGEVDLCWSHMIFKPAGYGAATPWHQDQAYAEPGMRFRNINFWLPLDGATIEGGCMQFIPKSHLGPVLPHTYLDPNDKQTVMVVKDQDYWSANGIAVPCPQGSCTLHHSYCLHYAGPNITDQPRRAFIIVCACSPQKLNHTWSFPWRD